MPPHDTKSPSAPHEHLSPAPLLVGVGALLLYFGIVYRGAMLAVGTLAFLGSLLLWVREDVGMYNRRHKDEGVLPGRDLGWWGMMLFLGTEVMLFGGLFAAFFTMRDAYPLEWLAAREHLDAALPLVTANTLILILSGVFAHYSYLAVKRGHRRRFITLLAVAMALGLTFLVLQTSEYLSLIAAGITLSSSQFGSAFYLLTGTHAAHVTMGLVFFGVVLVRALLGHFDAERHVAVETFAIYWHFVDVVWVGLYLVVYLGVL